MKSVLILGGTQFIGRTLVERLLQMKQYSITLFNRQNTDKHLFPSLPVIQGDRETVDVKKIAAQKWDFVIDCSCYFPASLANVLSQLQPGIERYIFISTCSVYNSDIQLELRNEHAVIRNCSVEQQVDRSDASYGHRKAECEHILNESNMDHVIFRSALVYGPYDHTDRFYYWLYQVKNHKTLLLPEYGRRKFSLTFVEDLVESIIQAIKQKPKQNIYNVISHPQASIAQIVAGTERLLKKETAKVNASSELLTAHNVRQWADMPLWIANDYFTYSSRKLKNDFGFEPTPFAASIAKTLNYFEARNWPKPTYGIPEETKQLLLNEAQLE